MDSPHSSASRSTGHHHIHPLLLQHFPPPMPDVQQQRGSPASTSLSPSVTLPSASGTSGWRAGHPPKWKSHSFRRERPTSSSFTSPSYRGNPYDLLYNPSPNALGLNHDAISSVGNGSHHSRIGRRCSDPATSVIAAVMASRGIVPHLPSPLLNPSSLLNPPLTLQSTSAHIEDTTMDEQPLDMSTKKKSFDDTLDLIKRSSTPESSLLTRPTYAVPRPSVITCAPSSYKRGKHDQIQGRMDVPSKSNGHRPVSHTVSGRSGGSSFGTSTSPSISSVSSSSSHSESDAISDRAAKMQILSSHGSSSDDDTADPVMEHFKRSLGGKYTELIRSKSSPISSSSSKSPPQKFRPTSNGIVIGNGSSNAVVTAVTQDVDDHFAKALGEQWLKLKSSNNPVKCLEDNKIPLTNDPKEGEMDEMQTQQETQVEEEVMDDEDQSPPSSPPRLVVEETAEAETVH